MKKLKISRLTPDSRYLQTVALKLGDAKSRDGLIKLIISKTFAGILQKYELTNTHNPRIFFGLNKRSHLGFKVNL